MPNSKAHRVVILGSERVGKTAVIEQLIFGNHVIGQGGPPTVGDIYEVCLETDKGTSEKLQIFDTPGSLFTSTRENLQQEQDHFLSIADGFLLVYEITSKASYDVVISLRQKIALKSRDLPVVVLGNKSDLNAIREVDFGLVQHWARAHGIRAYEVSVLDRDKLKDPFCYMAWRMANPGRQFPQIPSLSTAAAPLRPTLSLDKQHTTDKQQDSTGMQSDATDSQAKCPEDAKYPKHGLFPLADCLSSNKYKEEEQ